MARISLNPPRTVSYRIAEWFIRRHFGDMLDPFRAMGHNMPVAKAYSQLEQHALRWRQVNKQIKDLTEMAVAAKVGCSWCVDFGSWVAPRARHPA